MDNRRPSPLIIALEGALLCACLVVGILVAPEGNWDFALIGVLFAFAAVSDLTAVATPSRLRTSGSFLALVLAMVFLGGAPAALIGVAAICVGWANGRARFHYFLNNLVTYATFPLLGGIAFHAITTASGLNANEIGFYLLVFAIFILALLVNFAMIAGYASYVSRTPFWSEVRKTLLPVLPSELAAALMAVAVASLYHQVGISAIALFAVVLVTFQYLLGALLTSQERAEALERRTKELTSFQVGLLGALMRTLDLRDQMTARHSAAVARYTRALAERAQLSEAEQELAHIAGLLHDIGKFILPDRILKAEAPIDDDDWRLIRMHPQQGARVVGNLEGYSVVADIILAHHERIDGGGYPRGLPGEEIPEIAKMIAVADTYDVMTARDSYREAVSSFEAIQELRRVSGAQLEERYVESFIELLEGRDLTFRHGEDADFEAELRLEGRVEKAMTIGADRYAAGDAQSA